MVIPATAMAAHDLGIYKVEKHVDLESDDFVVELACSPGDYALDGMWRIDHADYDEDDNFSTTLGRAVDVAEAYPIDTVADVDTHYDGYHFLFNKNAIGRAQLKVFATCIRQKTEQSSGHEHPIVVTKLPPFTTAGGVGNYDTTNTACPINTFVAQSGYKINPAGSDPDPYTGHLSESWMYPNNRGWSWKMDVSQDLTNTTTVTYYLSCVSRKVPAAGGEKHKLVYRHQGPESHSIPAGKVKTKRIECKSHYKAVVAGFSFTPFSMTDPNPEFDPFLTVPHLWFLGMDPQPKNRDFRFLNSGNVSHPIQLRAICLNYRTT